MALGRPLAPLSLDPEERQTLERWTRRRKTAQALALRARIILMADEGGRNGEVAEGLGITRATVGKWRSRFLERGLDGLLDEPRPGAPRTITDEDVERVVTLTLEQTPEGYHPLEQALPGPEDGANPRVQSAGSGAPSPCNRIAARRSSSPPIPSSLKRSATSWASTRTHPSEPWCCASTRRARSRPWTEASRCFPCVRDRSSVGSTTMSATAPPPSSRP